MRSAGESRARVWVIWSMVVLVALAGCILLASRLLGGSGPDNSGDAVVAAEGGRPPGESPSGPARLRAGARQVTDPVSARAAARAALERVESEVAAARDPKERERLGRKRALILDALARFEAGPSP